MAVKKSTNIYKVLDLSCPEDMHVKANLAAAFWTVLNETGLTISDASILLNVPEPMIHAVIKGQFHDVEQTEILRWLEVVSAKLN
jgi:predicted XRE-type DNA-binding protein